MPRWTLADRMRKSLDAAGIGVSEIAEELGVTRGAVGKWINGHVEPRHPTLIAWAMRTGVSLEWLETGECDHSRAAREAGDAGEVESTGREEDEGHRTQDPSRPVASRGGPPGLSSAWARAGVATG